MGYPFAQAAGGGLLWGTYDPTMGGGGGGSYWDPSLQQVPSAQALPIDASGGGGSIFDTTQSPQSYPATGGGGGGSYTNWFSNSWIPTVAYPQTSPSGSSGSSVQMQASPSQMADYASGGILGQQGGGGYSSLLPGDRYPGGPNGTAMPVLGGEAQYAPSGQMQSSQQSNQGGMPPLPTGDWSTDAVEAYCRQVTAMGGKCQYKADGGGKPSGRVYLPDGRCFDTGGPGEQFHITWRDCSGKGSAPSTGGGGGGAPGVPARTTASSGNFGVNGPMWDAIQRLLQRGETPVDPNDPTIKMAVNAYRNQQERARSGARSEMAERMAQMGLNAGGSGSGAFDTGLMRLQEAQGENVAQYQSQLIVQELQSRRQDVVNALQFAQGEERMTLQWELAQLDQQLEYYRLAQQNNQFYDQFAYNIGRDNRNADLQFLQTLLG